MQPLLGRNRETSFLGDRDEIAQMPELHPRHHVFVAWRGAYKVFLAGASERPKWFGAALARGRRRIGLRERRETANGELA